MARSKIKPVPSHAPEAEEYRKKKGVQKRIKELESDSTRVSKKLSFIRKRYTEK